MAYPSLFSIIEHHFGIDLMSLSIFSCVISFHVASIALYSSSAFFKSHLCFSEHSICHKFSIGLRSGHFITSI